MASASCLRYRRSATYRRRQWAKLRRLALLAAGVGLAMALLFYIGAQTS